MVSPTLASCKFYSHPQTAGYASTPGQECSHILRELSKQGSLCDELADTTSLLDLALSVLAEVAGADDDRALGDAALTQDFAVAEGYEVEDWRRVGGLVGEEFLALLEGDEGPELFESCQ
jgi:hypothetical protein